ncbi:nucleoside-diphosphate kinase [Nigerium massiliense]|uniref:nucleoside-diphosphate kinase n=1 Tax=Nigerium massiliense TaxID=1522317 RepID=UPI00058FE66A|nr:nucleoside-diphosphate kinase [Nigerium massiliense]
MTDVQQTLVLIKPDAVSRGLVGAVLSRYETKGLAIEQLQLRRIDAAFADRHYAEHVDQPWYPGLRDFITSGPLVAVVLSGERAIEAVRVLNGATDGVKASPGSIRGDFASSNQRNIVHASDTVESAEREIGLWFPEGVSE